MKKLLTLFSMLGFIALASAQTSTTDDDAIANNPVTHYSIQIQGVTDLVSAKENEVYDYLKAVLYRRPEFNTTTGTFEVDSQVMITLPELNTKLTEFGFPLQAVNLKKGNTTESK